MTRGTLAQPTVSFPRRRESRASRGNRPKVGTLIVFLDIPGSATTSKFREFVYLLDIFQSNISLFIWVIWIFETIQHRIFPHELNSLQLCSFWRQRSHPSCCVKPNLLGFPYQITGEIGATKHDGIVRQILGSILMRRNSRPQIPLTHRRAGHFHHPVDRLARLQPQLLVHLDPRLQIA